MELVLCYWCGCVNEWVLCHLVYSIESVSLSQCHWVSVTESVFYQWVCIVLTLTCCINELMLSLNWCHRLCHCVGVIVSVFLLQGSYLFTHCSSSGADTRRRGPCCASLVTTTTLTWTTTTSGHSECQSYTQHKLTWCYFEFVKAHKEDVVSVLL